MISTASIVTYNTDRAELAKILQCLIESCIEKIYVVDNSPNDELYEFVTQRTPQIEYIWGHGNIGYGAAHNIAIKKAIENEVKYHLVVNPDIYFEHGTIEALVKYMDNHSNAGQVMPRVVYPDGELQYLCKLLPTPLDLMSRRFIPIKSYVKRQNYNFEMRKSGYDKEMIVPFLSGCFMFLRVEALIKTGGFDDRFFMYCEDIDLCRRISMANYQTLYYPMVQIVHAHKKESFKNKAMLKAHIKSAILYFNKWGWIFDKYRKSSNKRAINLYN